MPTKIILGKGTSLEHCTTLAGTYAPIPNATEFEGPNFELSKIPQTVLASPIKKNRPGLPEPPNSKVKFFYDEKDAVHVLLRAMSTTGTLGFFKLKTVDPDVGGTYATEPFSAYCYGWNRTGLVVDGSSEVEMTFEHQDIGTIS